MSHVYPLAKFALPYFSRYFLSRLFASNTAKNITLHNVYSPRTSLNTHIHNMFPFLVPRSLFLSRSLSFPFHALPTVTRDLATVVTVL